MGVVDSARPVAATPTEARPSEPDQAGRDLRVTGLIAGSIALAVLWVASALWSGAPFGPSALAEGIIRWTPGDLATFFIEVLGHWARRLLTIGAIAVALFVGIEALVRTSTHGTPRPVRAALILAFLAAVASFASPTQDANPALVVLVVGIAAAAYIISARLFATAIAGARYDEDRRHVIRMGFGAAAGLTVVGAIIGYLGRTMGGPNTDVTLVAPEVPAEIPDRPSFPNISGLTEEVTSVADHYVVDINLVQPAVDAGEWILNVMGEVDSPLELTFQELQSRFEVVQEYSVLCCVSNEVGGDLIGNSAWGGVRLADVLDSAGIRGGATDVVFRAADGYSDSIPVERALDSSVLLAVSQNGQPLRQEHGFPCRVRIPAIYGMKNVKWLESIELVTDDYTGYWQDRGWSDDATVRTQSRIDVAGDDFTARSGDETWIAGVAWAGARGISKVEVSTDGGASWADAMLKEPMAPAAWILWAYRWTPESSGTAEIVCRATDGDGNTQTDDSADPHPAGATGYPRASASVS
jgi:DMSO/TMAO reductase YedYZ molybdopterin-dependent catalytic subunit